MLRIFVTGDNHIGLKYAGHEQSSVLIERRIIAFKKMVCAANSESCDLFVITGDLFDKQKGITKNEIKTLLDMLSEFQGTVAVLPGNHDYFDADAQVWKYFRDLMNNYDNIMLMTEYRPYSLIINGEKIFLYPAHCTSLHSAPEQNNLGWIKNSDIPNDNAYRIGIAHGAVEGETIDKEGQYFLMSRKELESIPMDVWLIGHTHVPFPRDLTENFAPAGRIFNAGTHVQTNVNCNTEGQCFIVELSDNKSVRAKKFVSGNIRFYRKKIVLTAGNMEAILERELAEFGDNSVVEIELSGAVTGAEYENRRNTIENALSRFTESKYSESDLSKLISKDLIDAEFAETSFSAAFLTALLDEPKEAQLAYELLNSLREGK